MTFDLSSQRARIVERIRARLQVEGLDGYVAYTPQNNQYCSGFVSWFVGEHWRFHGGNLTVLPADPSLPLGLMVPEAEAPLARRTTGIEDTRGYGMWIETRDLEVIAAPPPDGTGSLVRPTWWDAEEQDAILRDLLGDRGLLGGAVGTDLSFATGDSAERFRRVAPRARWVDWTDQMFELRAIKQPFEIDRLARGVELQEIGFDDVRRQLRAGMTARDVRNAYTRAVLDAASTGERYIDFVDSWILAWVGGGGWLGDEAGSEGPPGAHGMATGDLVTLDGGVRIDGYKSDGARSYSFGRPPDAARRLHETLLAANQQACAKLIPGMPINEAFHAAERHMHRSGYPQYCRGQFGHSIGLEQFPEEPPYISREERRAVEAGMVFAVETPYYGPDLGALTVEDMVLITENGPEPINRLPRELVLVE
jgi:Xaa-Pro dipeptidase